MKRKNEYALQSIGKTRFLVPLGAAVTRTNGLFMINETGTLIWQLLASDCSVDDLFSTVVREFDVDEKTAQSDVMAFLDMISESGLLER